jgi:hypothetical protein
MSSARPVKAINESDTAVKTERTDFIFMDRLWVSPGNRDKIMRVKFFQTVNGLEDNRNRPFQAVA